MSHQQITSRLPTVFLLASSLGMAVSAFAASAPDLGAADSFAVYAGTKVKSVGGTKISGDLGVNPGSDITGFPPGEVMNGSIHTSDALALKAGADAATAVISLGTQAADVKLTGRDLAGMILKSGVYFYAGSAQLNGKLTLDAEFKPDSVFVFQISASFIAADGASIELINGAKASNVFFMIGNSATIGASAALLGTWLATSDITMGNSAKVDGKIISLTGAVTLDSNMITSIPVVAPTPTPIPSPTPQIEQPVTYAASCDFTSAAATGGGKGKGGSSLTCHAEGSVCVDGSKTPCITADKTIHSALAVTCSDNFGLTDQEAVSSMSGSMLSLAAKDTQSNKAMIEFSEFLHQADTLQSSLWITDSTGVQKSISGSCTLR